MWPHTPTLQHYKRIFTDESWYSGYINSLEYVVINTILSISVALPAAYAFSRYRFLGDKHLFFWLLSNRMAPAAVYALPFFNLYSAIGLFDTPWAVALAHCIFNVPLAVWILEGFVSGVPREIDETAFLDGYSFPRFFVKIFVPLIASGIGVAAFFCFMFSWVELLLARTLTSVNAKPIAADHDPHGVGCRHGLGTAGGSRRAHHHSRRARDLVRPQLYRARLRARPGVVMTTYLRMIGAFCFSSPFGRGRIWREATNPGEGLRSIDRPYPLTPALSPWERGHSVPCGGR